MATDFQSRHTELQHRLQGVGICGNQYVISKLGSGWHDQSYHQCLCLSAKASAHLPQKASPKGEFSVLWQMVQNWLKLNTQHLELNKLERR